MTQALSAARRACKSSGRILHACGTPASNSRVAVGWQPNNGGQQVSNGGEQVSRNKWAAVAEMLAVSLHAAAVQHEYLGQWAEALAAYHSARATAVQARHAGAAAGDVASSCTETLRAIKSACQAAERSIYKQQAVRLKPPSALPGYDLAPSFPAAVFEQHPRKAPLYQNVARSKVASTIWRPDAPYGETLSPPSPPPPRRRSQIPSLSHSSLRDGSHSPPTAGPAPDKPGQAASAGTAADFDCEAATDDEPSAGVSPVAASPPGAAASGPLWAVPSAVTAGVASQLLDGLAQPHHAFGNAQMPLWAPDDEAQSIASDTAERAGDDLIRGDLHASANASDLYAPVDVLGSDGNRSTDGSPGGEQHGAETAAWQLSFSEWERQRKAKDAVGMAEPLVLYTLKFRLASFSPHFT